MSVVVRTATEMAEGAGARVRRLMPVPDCKHFDPFVLFDHFELAPGTGFPEHPHRGFEAVTYLFEGEIEHRDNLGNVSRVGPGGAQRFTAGAGLRHSETASVDSLTTGIQLWVNLPRSLKDTAPTYEEAPADTIPEFGFHGGRERRIAGEQGRAGLLTPARYRHLLMEAGSDFAMDLPEGWRAIVYLRLGAARVNDELLAPGQAALIEHEASIRVDAQTGSELMIAAARPHGEPIRQRGPFVD